MSIADQKSVTLGQQVFTIGYPAPDMLGSEAKFTEGVVSSLSVGGDAGYMQISVPVQPGNSGGALVDERGNVVGVVSATLSVKAALVTSGALPQNVSYAVKSSFLLSFLKSVPEVSAKLKHPYPASERKFEDVVKEAQEAAALVLVY